VLVIGGALVFFRVAIPARLGLGLEFIVALVLIALGFANLRPLATDAGVTQPRDTSDARPFAVGVVHGLAGSAGVALLILAVIPDASWAVAYLIVFGLGTIAGMTLVTWIVAAPAIYAAGRVRNLQRGIRLAAGAISLVFGLVLARAIVVEGGLFTSAPAWIPR
jgi:high-affinity nickel-transport protein